MAANCPLIRRDLDRSESREAELPFSGICVGIAACMPLIGSSLDLRPGVKQNLLLL
jgi:hypothetical protein